MTATGIGTDTFVVRAASAVVDGRLQAATVGVVAGRIDTVLTGAAALDDGAVAGVASGWPVVDVPPGVNLLPGNVDTHVHVNEPGRSGWEGFATATEAAARGGLTCLLDMPLNSIPPTLDLPSLSYKRAVAGDRLHVDVGFWGGVVPANLGALQPLWDAGVYGFKCFLSDSGVAEFPPLDGAGLTAAMREIAGFGGLLLVHAEDPDVLAAAPAVPSRRFRDFVASRPDQAEVVAIRKVLARVRECGTRTHIVHLSSARALDDIAAARAEGLPLTVETCPHYLVFDVDGLPDGAPEFKCCPPIRDRGNQDALWDALLDGLVDCVVSDHSPSTEREKRRGDGDLQQAWGGIAGLQVSFPAVADAAARRGLGVEQVSAWMAEGPARVAGVRGKGRIAPGYDADLVWFEPDRPVTVDGSLLAHRNKLSAYTGRRLAGSVSRTLVRGRTIFDGREVGSPRGLRLRRDPPADLATA